MAFPRPAAGRVGCSLRALALAAAALLAATCGGEAPNYVATQGRLPAIAGTTLDGGTLQPSDYRGRVVVLNFWNQDCPPCRREMPILQRDAGALFARGVRAIGVLYVGGGWPDDPTAARTFLRQVGVTYPTIVDQGSRWTSSLPVSGIPTTVVADRQGRLRYRVLGTLRPGELQRLVDLIDG